MRNESKCNLIQLLVGSWWWTGRPGVLQSMGSQRVGHDWTTELSWIDNKVACYVRFLLHNKLPWDSGAWKCVYLFSLSFWGLGYGGLWLRVSEEVVFKLSAIHMKASLGQDRSPGLFTWSLAGVSSLQVVRLGVLVAGCWRQPGAHLRHFTGHLAFLRASSERLSEVEAMVFPVILLSVVSLAHSRGEGSTRGSRVPATRGNTQMWNVPYEVKIHFQTTWLISFCSLEAVEIRWHRI